MLKVVTADRDVSDLLMRDPRVDKIAFTGSTAAERRIASLCGERIARFTLELGGKSAVILDDTDLAGRPRSSRVPSAAQSGIGREGGREGLLPYLESKTVILEDVPTDYRTK